MRISDWSSDVCSSDLQLGGDKWHAGHLYLWEGGHWALKDGFITSTLIHEGGKRLSVLAWLGVVACAAVAWGKPAWQSWRRPLLYLALAVLLSTSVVAWMKSWTHVDCPWDPVGLGGTRISRSDEHTTELQSLMRISYSVVCLQQ